MPKKRVFVDTNVILECFRINVWSELTQRCQVETVEMCRSEALAGDASKPGYILVDSSALQAGCHTIHVVTQREVDILVMEHEKMLNLDAGELHLFAYLHANKIKLSEVAVLSTADKGAIVRANDNSMWLEWLQSLQAVLVDARVSRQKIDALRPQHTSAFLSKVRLDVRNGVIP